jgi:hypothetical protein
MASIPRVAVIGQGRSGTSMLCRMLEFGGLIFDKQPDNQDRNYLFRNPYGLYENHPMLIKNQFVNSLKNFTPSRVSLLPSDYKLIFIGRPLSEILASWNEIADRAIAEGRDVTQWRIDALANANSKYTEWQTLLPTLPNYLSLEYNTVISDPQTAVGSIATFLNTADFTFDSATALTAIDNSLYIKRS